MPALDYSRIADLYDVYCRFGADVPYFVRALAGIDGDVLELMAGTGRLSVPLARAGVALTCVDSDAPMLSILARKIPARAICADVRALPFRRRFRAVILAFQGLSELVEPADRAALFAECARVLDGIFICTMHNPAVRVRTLDGAWHTAGVFRADDGRAVEVSVSGTCEAGIVTGEQRVIVRNVCGATVRDERMPLRFALPEPAEVLALGGASGMSLVSLHGSYDGAPFDAATSPAIIATFASAAGMAASAER
ncbi:MAG: class I SAM-dependent methyltransferase [Thermoanaerobaculia bacterium]